MEEELKKMLKSGMASYRVEDTIPDYDWDGIWKKVSQKLAHAAEQMREEPIKEEEDTVPDHEWDEMRKHTSEKLAPTDEQLRKEATEEGEDSISNDEWDEMWKDISQKLVPINERLRKEAIEEGWYHPVYGLDAPPTETVAPVAPTKRKIRPLYIVRQAAILVFGLLLGGAIVWRARTGETRIVVVHDRQNGPQATPPSSTEVLIADSRSKNETPRRFTPASGHDSTMNASPDKYWHPTGTPRGIDTALRIAIQEWKRQLPAYHDPYARPPMLTQAAPVRAQNYRQVLNNYTPIQAPRRPVEPPPVFTASVYDKFSDKPL